jgi:hypothetical protein
VFACTDRAAGCAPAKSAAARLCCSNASPSRLTKEITMARTKANAELNSLIEEITVDC